MSAKLLSRLWFILACSALLISGLLAIVITGAKAPFIKELIKDIDLIRWCLVIHVNLAMLVWFTAIPAGLMTILQKKRTLSLFSLTGFVVCVSGVLLMLSVPPNQHTEVVLSNYIPMLGHNRYYLALILYALGIVIEIARFSIGQLSSNHVQSADSERAAAWMPSVGFGISVGNLFILAALISFVFSFRELLQSDEKSLLGIFELGMWGGGHLLQHAAAVYTVCAWIILATVMTGKNLFPKPLLVLVFLGMSLPLLRLPYILTQSVFEYSYRVSFTQLMQWGIAPSVIIFIIYCFFKIPRPYLRLRDYRSVTLVLSQVLMISAYIFGACIRGYDMRIPGHYHASIGAVTLTLMGLAYYFLTHNVAVSAKSNKNILRAVWVYGTGQSTFATGMFIAGSFGLSRKTYGIEHIFDHPGQITGFVIMAIGGLVTFLGGVYFIRSTLPQFHLRSDVLPKPATHSDSIVTQLNVVKS